MPPLTGTVDELLDRAKKLYDTLEYDKVIPVAAAVLEREGIPIDKRLDAYVLQGSCLAIVGSPIDAEAPFRFLLRGRPDFEMPPDTPPKILAVFRKVQVEERTIVEEMYALERERTIASIEINGSNPDSGRGGRPLDFSYHLRDPRGAVSQMSVKYRRQGQAAFSSLALQRNDSGDWLGEIPGEWTADPSGFQLEYFVTTADKKGAELKQLFDATKPLTIAVAAGEVVEAEPFYETVWFWLAAAGVVVASGTAGYLIYDRSTALPDSDLGEVRLP